ncbi:MAG: NADP-dependent malic enzyme [Clostridia bacterium]|nr:NADP-dependent malic enzyme [Clostridia bacterium]
MDVKAESLKRHKQWQGKIEIVPRCELSTRDDLSTAYTPGVAQPCLAIKDDPEQAYTYTRRGNLVAVVTDGSAVLGLGNIGGLAGMPVMEGKCALFKAFGDVDAFPICLATQDTDEIVSTVKAIAPGFGGINLEDISAPRCFEIERRLIEELDIPVFHDDQHGTAVVVLAALYNALKLAGKRIDAVKVAMSGPGAAGTAIAKLLLKAGVRDLVMVDFDGILYPGKPGMDWAKTELAEMTNPRNVRGGLHEAMAGADVFIGVSAGGIVKPEMIKSMAEKSIVFGMANPVPEIYPDEAIRAGAFIAGSGRSDFPNQINNVLAFPGIFRGALDARVKRITDDMKLRAAAALAALVPEGELTRDNIIPSALDKSVSEAVAKAVAKA